MLFKLPQLSKVPRRYLIFAALLIFIAVASAGIAIFISLQQVPKDNAPSTSTGDNGKLQELPAEKKADEADKQAADGNVNAGVQTLDSAIQNTSDSQEQFVFYSRKATLLYNNKDLNGALDAAQKAFDIQKSSDGAAFVGQIAQEKGDTAMALTYYKKAISLIDPNDPFADEDKQYYQDTINELGGKS